MAPGIVRAVVARLDGKPDDAWARRSERVRRIADDGAPQVAQPEDVAAAVVLLASDTLSGHVTGQVVTVAGGMEGRVVHADPDMKTRVSAPLSFLRRMDDAVSPQRKSRLHRHKPPAPLGLLLFAQSSTTSALAAEGRLCRPEAPTRSVTTRRRGLWGDMGSPTKRGAGPPPGPSGWLPKGRTASPVQHPPHRCAR